MKKIQKKIQKILDSIFVKGAHSPAWMITSGVLLVVIIFSGVYTYHTGFNQAVNGLLWGTKPADVQQKEKLFHLPVTVVYNTAVPDQKAKMDQFLDNLVDPSRALANTDLQTTWLDAKDPKAQALITQTNLKYLPQIFVDNSISQHPQFDALKQYLNQKGDLYFIRLAPLEHLQIPPVDGGYITGADPTKAKVVIQDYESYSCDHCATAHESLKKILQDYPSDVSVVYKHFEPGDVYNQIAQGVDCAADQKKFPQMQDAVFKEQPTMLKKLQSYTSEAEAIAFGRLSVETTGKKIGLNMKTFKECLDQKTHYKAINDQTLDAIDYGINGPPAFFINQKFQSGLLSYDEFKALVEAELKK